MTVPRTSPGQSQPHLSRKHRRLPLCVFWSRLKAPIDPDPLAPAPALFRGPGVSYLKSSKQ